MGRYYDGDIEGKFWFGVQSSTCADRFGCVGEASYLFYNFDKSHLPQVEAELDRIRLCTLGEDNLNKLDKFFDENNGYSDERLAKYLGVLKDKLQFILSEYADYKLGLQIKECLEQEGRCRFEAEL